MDKNYCKNCAYYYQHYAMNERKIFRVFCGHCAFANPRRKHPDAVACEHFTLAPPDENAFANKEYLSKELLQYVLNLELLPEIKEMDHKIL